MVTETIVDAIACEAKAGDKSARVAEASANTRIRLIVLGLDRLAPPSPARLAATPIPVESGLSLLIWVPPRFCERSMLDYARSCQPPRRCVLHARLGLRKREHIRAGPTLGRPFRCG